MNRPLLMSLMTALLLDLAACGSTTGSPAAPSPEAGPPDSSTPSMETADSPCVPGPVPAAVRAAFGLSPFYVKHVGYQGFPIVSSDKTSDQALCAAREVLSHLFSHRPELVGRLVEHRIRLAIIAKAELTTDIPEYADLTPKDYWNERARGLGATLARPAASVAEENLLCALPDRWAGESILIHEFSHAIFNIAIDLYEPAMKRRLDEAYGAAMTAGLFQNTYAATNHDEYWAEGAQDWFDANLEAVPANGIHNEIHTRAQLGTYNAGLAAIEAEVFGDDAWRSACP